MRLEGKTAAILGGGAGIGREIALALARHQVSVFVGDIDEAAGRDTADAVAALGVRSEFARCDIGDDASVADFADAAYATLGGVDLLFNHAGASLGGLLEQVTSEDWNWLLNLNVTGLGRSITAFLPRMTEQGGWIVNTSSGLGLFHDVPFAAPYIATKAAIIAYSRALATYVRNRGIGVSVFCPDLTMTGFLGAGRIKGIPPEMIAGSLPMDRMQTAADAAAVLIDGLLAERFLISATAGTPAKLFAMAGAELEPGSDAFDTNGRPVPMLQKGSIQLPEQTLDEALALFRDFARRSREHYGCRTYDYARDPDEPARLVIFEAWESQAAVDAHAAAPETLAFAGKLFALGATDFSVAKI